MKWAAVAAAVGLLAACGGGGGGGSAPADTAVVVEGVAAKGLIANAVVTVHQLRDDGTVDDTPLASTTTGNDGTYKVAFNTRSNARQLVRLRAQAGTTHADEVSGRSQPLPSGFEVRSPVAPGANVRAPLTPFSEMTLAAAARLPGGLTADNTAKAASTLTQLFGFNPLAVEPRKTTDSGATPDEQRQAVLLAAVSQLANTNGLGCTGTLEANTKCVVDKLAAAASAETFDLGSAVSGALVTAVTEVLGNSALAGSVAAPALANVIANLQCTGAFCKPAAPAGALTAAQAIAAAKTFLNDLRSDFTVLFGLDATGDGAVGSQVEQFRAAMRGAQLPADQLVKDLHTVILGIELYNDYKAGRTTVPARSSWAGQVAAPVSFTGLSAASCTLYQVDPGSAPTPAVATSASNANFIGCGTAYYTSPFGVPTAWRHGWSLTPGSAGAFTYSTRAQTRNLSTGVNTPLSPAVTGSVTTTTDGAGRLTAFGVSGSLAPQFEFQGNTLLPGTPTWNVSGTRSFDAAAGTSTTTLAPSQLVVKDASNATVGTLALRSGTLSFANGAPTSAALDMSWSTSGASFTGQLRVSDPVDNSDGSDRMPTRVVFDGRLDNVSGTTSTEFLTGRLSATAVGFEQTSGLRASGPTNFFTTNLSLSGTATAPGRPQLLFSAGASVRSDDEQLRLATLQYRSLVNGAAKLAVSVSNSRSATGASLLDVSEVTAGLAMRLDRSAPNASLLQGATRIGELDRGKGIVTFTDGSFVSADLGF